MTRRYCILLIMMFAGIFFLCPSVVLAEEQSAEGVEPLTESLLEEGSAEEPAETAEEQGPVCEIKVEGNDSYYYVDSVKQYGVLFTLNGKKYFAKADGKLAKSELVLIEGEYYYADADCSIAEGIFTNKKGASYYADNDGVVNTEAKILDAGDGAGNRVANRTGQLENNKFVVSNNKTYYVTTKGKYMVGVFYHPNGKYYFANNEGQIITTEGWRWWNDNYYRVTTGGPLARSTIVWADGKYWWINSSCIRETDSFIFVAYDLQRLRLIVNGVEILNCPIVSGKPSTPTPKGEYFQVLGKSTNVRLKGDDWDVNVDYWVAFKGSEFGFHDASWRGSWEYYQGRYLVDGSHGCVNMRIGDAATLYAYARKGMRVVIR
ncbi:MAG: L,D-transpeptidase family protein [Mogibacterium sp.]|nr:L,D-transpeptidase family protein [Mogibacterium sp.]